MSFANGQFFTTKDMVKSDPNPFCETLPFQLLYFDNTAWQQAQHCWRHFWYGTLRGLRRNPGPDGVAPIDLTFGSLIHDGADVYTKACAAGADPELATQFALAHVLDASWPAGQEKDVFGGYYALVFKCSDTTRTVTKKGIVRCPWSFKEHLVPRDTHPAGLDFCPGCNRPVEQRPAYLCTERTKNRHTAARTIVALCDAFTAGSIRPRILQDGRIGSEYRWFQPLALPSPDGVPYHMTGSFDGVAEAPGIPTLIPELKTTRRDPNAAFFSGLEMSPQVHTYDWAGAREFGPATRVMLYAIHIGVGFTEIYQKPVYFSPGSRKEWEGELEHYIQEAEIRAKLAAQIEADGADPATAYPRRLSACASLPGAPTTPCPFRDFCRLDPSDREDFLASNFHVDRWSPLGVKGVVTTEGPEE